MEAQTLDLLDKDFKLTNLNMLRDLKKCNKIKNMNKEMEIIKNRNSQVKNYNNGNKKFTRGVQQQWT